MARVVGIGRQDFEDLISGWFEEEEKELSDTLQAALKQIEESMRRSLLTGERGFS